MSIITWVKTHPYLAGGGVLALGLGVVLLNSGSSSSDNSGAQSNQPSAAQLAADAQVQIAQIQANASNQQTQAALNAHNADTASQQAIAALAAQTQQNHDTLAANVSLQSKLDDLIAYLAGLNHGSNSGTGATSGGATIIETEADTPAPGHGDGVQKSFTYAVQGGGAFTQAVIDFFNSLGYATSGGNNTYNVSGVNDDSGINAFLASLGLQVVKGAG